MRFIIDWVSLIVGSKFTVFALFYFIFEGKFPSTSPRGAYIWRGDLMEGFLRYWIDHIRTGGLPLGNKDEDKYDNRLLLIIPNSKLPVRM